MPVHERSLELDVILSPGKKPQKKVKLVNEWPPRMSEGHSVTPLNSTLYYFPRTRHFTIFQLTYGHNAAPR